jgi:glycosyltransferase involved in cell wall biosynthesis
VWSDVQREISMNTPPDVAFVAGADPFDICNRRSVVGSFLCSVLTHLNGPYRFTVNGFPFQPCADPAPFGLAAQQPSMLTRIARQLLPTRLKEALKEPGVFIRQNRLANRLFLSLASPQLVFELYKYGSRVGLDLAKRWGCPYVIFHDAPEVEQYRDIHGFRGWLAKRAVENERESLRSADAVIVYSEAIRHQLTSQMGLDAVRCHVFQTLDYSRLTPAVPRRRTDPPTFGYAGTFMRWHNVPQLVMAFERIRDAGINARLLLIGTGADYARVRRQAADSRWQSDIEMTGFVDGPLLEQAKARMDIGVLPGTMPYNLPTKIFEYGAAGVATIAPRSPTVLELFPAGEAILAFDEGSVTSLADSLKRLAVDHVLRARLGLRLQAVVQKRHTIHGMKAFYDTLFQSLIRAKSPVRSQAMTTQGES